MEADIVTYGAVLSVCEKSLRWEEAMAVLRQRVQTGPFVVQLQNEALNLVGFPQA